MFSDLLSAPEVAAILRVSRQVVVQWANQGRLRGFRVGRNWRFERAAVEEFIKASTPEPQPPKKAEALLAFA